MGVFDFFKKKPDEAPTPEAEKSSIGSSAPESTQASATETALDKSLEKTKTGFFSRIGKSLIGRSTVDADFLDDLEEALVAADVGVQTTVKIINRLEARAARDKYFNTAELNRILREEIIEMLAENKQQAITNFNLTTAPKPYIIMVVGVNGVGKTTTIGKLAHQFKKSG
ncbi:MAG: signal recognition particle receptor subunit alpha, partial [Bacteroidia bacterium]